MSNTHNPMRLMAALTTSKMVEFTITSRAELSSLLGVLEPRAGRIFLEDDEVERGGRAAGFLSSKVVGDMRIVSEKSDGRMIFGGAWLKSRKFFETAQPNAESWVFEECRA